MTANQVQMRRGTSAQIASMTPAQGEVVVNTTDNTLHVGDGSTAGGTKLPTKAYVDAAVAAATGELVNYDFTEVTSFIAATGITPIPMDNSVPTNTEGYEWGSISYTPSSASNRLLIRATLFAGENSNVGDGLVQSLLKDSDTSALTANCSNVLFGPVVAGTLITEHNMVAGTTSSITFRARASGTLGDTNLNINGAGGVRLFGGVARSKIEVWEFKP